MLKVSNLIKSGIRLNIRLLYKTHFIEYTHKKRYWANKLMNLIERLIYEIDREWKRGKPQPVAIINLKRQTPASLALKVANFVYSQSDRRASQRQLQRYTNKRKADLEGLHEWLKLRYEIVLHKKGKSVFYLGTRSARSLPRGIKSEHDNRGLKRAYERTLKRMS